MQSVAQGKATRCHIPKMTFKERDRYFRGVFMKHRNLSYVVVYNLLTVGGIREKPSAGMPLYVSLLGASE